MMSKRWSKGEEEKLRKLYSSVLTKNLQKHFPNRTICAIRTKASRLKVKASAKKLSKINKGKHFSEEHRRKISQNHAHYWKGKHHSEETKKKLSKAHKGKSFTKKHKQKISEALKGRTVSEKTKRKMSEALKGENNPNYGKHLSEKTKRKLSEALKREKNPNWNNGSSFEPYGVDFNDELKKQIRKRDNYQCQLCRVHQNTLSQRLSIHHIDYCKQNNVPENLVSLCHSCHNKTGFNRKKWTHYFTTRYPLVPQTVVNAS